MKLKQLTKLIFIVFTVFALSSCNDSSSTYNPTELSGDAQIYSFKIDAKPYTVIDTANYPALAKAKFAIDQGSLLVYNPDSLPYQTTLRKCALALGYNSNGVGKIELIYPEDSIVEWNTTDSIDFSTFSYPRIRMIPLNSSKAPREYTIKILIHKVDPDAITWNPVVATNYPTSISSQKTLLVNDKFYTFTVNTSNKVYLSVADKPSGSEPDVPLTYTTNAEVTGLSADVKLESITLYDGKLFAVDNNKQGYVSTDISGASWTKTGLSNNVINIVGVLPTTNVLTDSLLVITGDGYFAKTSDLKELTIGNEINNGFPTSGYSSVTNYDRNNLNNCILAITGGEGSSDFVKTWSVKTTDNNALQVISNQSNTVFPEKDGIVTFLYDGYMYALTENKFYKTRSYGYKWTIAPDKEMPVAGIPKASGQSVIVDSDNYIWIFGGKKDSDSTPVQEVWRGRINKLNPKQ